MEVITYHREIFELRKGNVQENQNSVCLLIFHVGLTEAKLM